MNDRESFAQEIERRLALRDTATPSTGDIIGELTAYLDGGRDIGSISREQLQRWHDGVVFAAACLDPDNPPLTSEQLKGMRRRR